MLVTFSEGVSFFCATGVIFFTHLCNSALFCVKKQANKLEIKMNIKLLSELDKNIWFNQELHITVPMILV